MLGVLWNHTTSIQMCTGMYTVIKQKQYTLVHTHSTGLQVLWIPAYHNISPKYITITTTKHTSFSVLFALVLAHGPSPLPSLKHAFDVRPTYTVW